MSNLLRFFLVGVYKLVFIVLYGRVGLWRGMSRLVQKFEKKADGLPRLSGLPALERVLQECKYKADGIGQLLDTARHPLASWKRKLDGQPIGDCEDFSFLALCLLAGMPPQKKPVNPLSCMSVFWMDGFKMTGHTVALFESNGRLGDISNWGLHVGPKKPNLYARIHDIAGKRRVIGVCQHGNGLTFLGSKTYKRFEGPNATGFIK